MPTAAPTATSPMISGGSPTVFVSDMNRAVRFYTEALGLKIAYRAGDHFAMIDAGGGLQIGLHPPASNAGAPGTRGSIQIGLNVADIDAAVGTLQSRGVTFDLHDGRPVRDDGAVRLAFFTDPDGNDLYLCQVIKW
jgi:catechol 2,3-dioxygenase-like lactoylglutathione lyase family enzyme